MDAPDATDDAGTDAGSPRDGGARFDAGAIDPTLDTDGDGLPDVFELAANAPAILDPTKVDTNDDGTPDGDEDPDGDGLTNLEELALARLLSVPEGCTPSPVRKTLALELDAMSGRLPSDAVLENVASAFAALDVRGAGDEIGVDLCIYPDEIDLSAAELGADPGARSAYLAAHGPRFTDRREPPIPYDKLLHAMIVTRRSDLPSRGGDTLSDPDGDREKSGVLIYRDALAELHPACGTPTLPPVTLDEAIAGSLVHELGHTLQLGHDTDVGGGINHWNIMSVQSSCGDAQARMHGAGNADRALGNTEAVRAPRFSSAATGLMDFEHKVSADVSALESDTGREM